MPIAIRTRESSTLWLFVIGLAYVGINAAHLTAPPREWESTFVEMALYARNSARLGWLDTRFGMVDEVGPPHTYYFSRPPLSTLVLSMWFRCLGDSAWVHRLSLILVGLGSILAFSALARTFVSENDAVLATAFFAFNPMFLLFSLIVDHAAYSLFFSLLAWNAARRSRLAWTLGFVVLACLSDWPGYFAALSLIFFFGRSRTSLAVAITASACFALHVLHTWWLDPTGEYVRTLFAMAAGHARPAGFSAGDFILREGAELLIFFTPGLLMLAGIGIAKWVRRRAWTPLLLALLGLEEIVFLKHSYEHKFLAFPLVALIALAAVASRPRKFVFVGLTLAWIVPSIAAAGFRLASYRTPELSYREGLAIREATPPGTRVLTLLNGSLIVRYTADRLLTTIGVETEGALAPTDPDLLRPTDSVVADEEALLQFLQARARRFDVVVVGALERATPENDPIRSELFAKIGIGTNRKAGQGLLDRDHPIRTLLRRMCEEEVHSRGFIFYWMRPQGR